MLFRSVLPVMGVGEKGKVVENMMKRAYDMIQDGFVETWKAKLSSSGWKDFATSPSTGAETLAGDTTKKKTLLALIAGIEGLNGAMIREV